MCSTCGCAEGNLYIEGDEHRPPLRVSLRALLSRPAQSGGADRHHFCPETV